MWAENDKRNILFTYVILILSKNILTKSIKYLTNHSFDTRFDATIDIRTGIDMYQWFCEVYTTNGWSV